MGYGYRTADHAETVMAMPYEALPEITAYDDLLAVQDDFATAWDGMISTLHLCLSSAWRTVDDGPWRRGHPGGHVIAQSAQHELIVEEDRGGYGYAYISIVVRHALHNGSEWSVRMLPLAEAQLPIVAQSFFDRVSRRMSLRIPQGYVSAPYQSRTAVKSRAA